jgi:hypothetical protein
MNKKFIIESEEIKRILSLHKAHKIGLSEQQSTTQPSTTKPPQKSRQEIIQFFATAKDKGCLTDPTLKYDTPYKFTGENAYYIKGPSHSMKGMVKRVYDDFTWAIVDPKDGRKLKEATWVCSALTKTEQPKTDGAQTATGTLNQEQQQFIEKWTGGTQGYIYNPSRLEQVDKVSVDVLNLGAPAGLFPKGTVLWYDPNKQKDISRTDDSVLDDILDNQSINRRACKKNIEDFYKAFQTRKSVVIDPAKLDQSKRIVQACKDQHYGNWGILGGGKKWDNILDILSGKVSGGTPSSSPYRLQ